jgi:hypothetical protein
MFRTALKHIAVLSERIVIFFPFWNSMLREAVFLPNRAKRDETRWLGPLPPLQHDLAP